MAETKVIKINARSATIVEGKSRAPNRSMYYAMGYQESDFKKPMVGVANGHSTITPCNSGLQKLADAAVAGILRKLVATPRFSARPPSATAWPWAPRA
jgi:dihydroxy-acid dehydratase